MPDSEVSVKFSTKAEAALWRAFVKLGEEAGKAGGAGNDAANGINKIDPAIKRFAASAKQITATPLERFNEQLVKLDKAMELQLVTAEEYARIKQKFETDLKIDTEPIKELSDEEKRAAKQAAEAKAELERFAESINRIKTTPLERFEQKMATLRATFREGLVDERGFKAGHDAFKAEYDATQIKEVTEEEKRAAAEAEKARVEMERFGESVKKITATPLDRLNDKMEKLRAAAKAGVIDPKQFKAAEGQFQTDYAKENLGSVVRAHSILRSENQKTGESAKSLGVVNTQTWASIVTAVSTGSQAVAGIAKAAFGQVKQALQEIRQEADKASRNLGESLKSQGTLAQLGATPEENKKLTRMADAAFMTGSVESRAQAADLVKSLSNANKLNELPLFGRMQRTGLVGDAGKFAGMLNTIQTSMGVDAGNSEQLASMVVQAGTKSYDDVNALIAGAAKAGAAAKGAKSKTSELLAGTAVMSQALGGSDLGGERMKAFYESLERNPRLRGENMLETLENIQKRTGGGKTDKVAKLLGSSEAMGAFQVLYQNRGDLAQQIGDIETARDKSYAAKKMDWLESDPARQAEIRRRASLARSELEKERTLGQPAALAQAAIDEESANARLGKVTGLQSGIARGMMNTFGVTTEGEQGREISGYVARKAGDIQRTWLGDRQLIAERARGLASDSHERQMITGSLRATDQELKMQQSGANQFDANRTMGIAEDGPLFRQRSQQQADRDAAAAAQMRAAQTQADAARDMKEFSGQMLEFGRLLTNQQNIVPVVPPDLSRRAQMQHAVPAE